MMHDNTIKISAIICTYNGEDRISTAVDSLIKQSYDSDKYEIIIVDNNSEDDTRTVSESIIAEVSDMKIKYVFEEKRGLSNARNRGIREAEGEIIAFMDDDAVAERNWLLNIDGILSSSSIHAVGGKVLPIFEAPRPYWLYPGIDSILTILDLGEQIVQFEYPHNSPCGTNMAFKKGVFEKIGYFDPTLGRKQEKLLGAEESDLFLRMQAGGLKFIYCPDCIVHHSVPKERLIKQYVRKRFFYQGYSTAFISLKYDSFVNVVKKDLRLLFKRNSAAETLNAPGEHVVRGFFYYEVKFILYASYMISLIAGVFKSGRGEKRN